MTEAEWQRGHGCDSSTGTHTAGGDACLLMREVFLCMWQRSRTKMESDNTLVAAALARTLQGGKRMC